MQIPIRNLVKDRELKNGSKNNIYSKVSHPPLKPLILFDGYCGFCRKWIGWWRNLTGDQVLYEPYQEAGPRFPEIDPQRYTQSLQLIQPDGWVLQGAEAVIQSLEGVVYLRWLGWSYCHVPGFSRLSEWVYRKVAENRHRVWLNSSCCKH